MILIIPFISSLEIYKLNPFPALKALFHFISLSNFFIAFEAKLPISPGKLSLFKGMAKFASALLSKLANQKPKYPSDWIILDIWVLLYLSFYLSFISVDIFLAKTFLILVVCLVARNN